MSMEVISAEGVGVSKSPEGLQPRPTVPARADYFSHLVNSYAHLVIWKFD